MSWSRRRSLAVLLNDPEVVAGRLAWDVTGRRSEHYFWDAIEPRRAVPRIDRAETSQIQGTERARKSRSAGQFCTRLAAPGCQHESAD